MLSPGIIPSKEPMIRVGIILPEDKQKEVKFESNSEFTFRSKDNSDSLITNKLEISVIDNFLHLKGSRDQIQFQQGNILLENDQRASVSPVLAGRNFHWKKQIEVELAGKIEIQCINGFLVLINELPLEIYLACVATSEMSSACPETYIQTQAIVARSWMLANIEQKHRHLGFDVCNDDCCQRYQGSGNLNKGAWKASNKSKGLVLMHDDKICDARYSKSCGGVMEKFENLWEDRNLPYMQNKVDAVNLPLPDLSIEEKFKTWIHTIPNTFCSPHFIKEDELIKYLGSVDESSKYFRWEVSIKQEELLNNFVEKTGIKAKAIREMRVLSRAGSGRMLELELSYINFKNKIEKLLLQKDYRIREILHPSFLYSSACLIFEIPNKGENPDFLYKGGGWGHGAGLCQIGALAMSLHGYDYDKILEHYYPGSKIAKIYK